MRRTVPLLALLVVLLAAPSLAAGPSKAKPKATPQQPDVVDIEASDVEGADAAGTSEGTAPEESLDYSLPEESDAQVLGADFVDGNFLFTIPSPGAEWVRITPVPNAPALRAAFVHTRGEAVLAMITVAVDPAPKQKDVAAYAQAAFATLTSPPLLFKIKSKGMRPLAGKNAFTVVYTTADGARTYEQAYFPGASGTIVVLTFQSPTSVYEREAKAFRAAAAGMKL